MLHLLPVPKNIVLLDSAPFLLGLETRIGLACRPTAMAKTGAQQLQAEIASACGLTAEILPGTGRAGDVTLTLAADGSAQGYRLEITAEGVTVTGHDEAGLLHGVQTLRQIIRQSGWTLPALTIQDAPDYPARGFYHDQTRGRVGTMAWLKHLADEACFYKLNQLQLYVEHSYLYCDLTELWATAVTPLTAEEIMELDDYCAARGVELVPSMASFGHLMELLRTKTYAPLSELPESEKMPSTMPNRMAHLTIDPSNPAAFDLIAGMVDEYMQLFRTDKFNFCADETFDLGKGRNQGKDERALYMGFVRKLAEHVASRGRIPMFWGDIILRFPEGIRELPEGTICLNWGYSMNEHENNTRMLAQAGAKQYVCPGVCGWDQWIPQMNASHENIRRMAEYGRKYGAKGLLNTDWGDHGHINDPRFSLPGMVAGACASWGELPQAEQLWEALSVLAYRDRSGEVLKHVAALAGCQVYSWWGLVRHKTWVQGELDRPCAESPLGHAEDDRIARADAAISLAEDGLRACCSQMDSAGRAMIARWLVASAAIRLWNHVGHAVSAGRKDAALAGALERWLRRYEAVWREISRESELWRIRDVTVWYADQLR